MFLYAKNVALSHFSNYVMMTLRLRNSKNITFQAIEPNCEIFNTFGDMSNSRLLQMYGFTEEKNPYDDVYLPDDIIKAAIEKHEVEAKDAKIKLLDSLGFFSEGR